MAAENRLREERKNWRRDHPHGFVAKPITKPDGTQDLFEWDIRVSRCGLPVRSSLPAHQFLPAPPLIACRLRVGRSRHGSRRCGTRASTKGG